MIVQTARNFGIHSPLPDTPSLPIGADEVYVVEHAVAYATFPNLGKAVVPHAALEVRPAPANWCGASTATAGSRSRSSARRSRST